MLLQRAGADLAEGIDALEGTEEAFRHRVPSPSREANKLEERETGKANEAYARTASPSSRVAEVVVVGDEEMRCCERLGCGLAARAPRTRRSNMRTPG